MPNAMIKLARLISLQGLGLQRRGVQRKGLTQHVQ
jgi:hypothetical protein